MKTFLIVYKDEYPKYDIQKLEGYWDLSYEQEPNIIIEIDEEDDNDNLNNPTDTLSKTKSLDEMEDEYWSLVDKKNSYDVLDEVNIIRNDDEENKNNRLNSTDNEVTIIEFEEEKEQLQE